MRTINLSADLLDVSTISAIISSDSHILSWSSENRPTIKGRRALQNPRYHPYREQEQRRASNTAQIRCSSRSRSPAHRFNNNARLHLHTLAPNHLHLAPHRNQPFFNQVQTQKVRQTRPQQCIQMPVPRPCGTDRRPQTGTLSEAVPRLATSNATNAQDAETYGKPDSRSVAKHLAAISAG